MRSMRVQMNGDSLSKTCKAEIPTEPAEAQTDFSGTFPPLSPDVHTLTIDASRRFGYPCVAPRIRLASSFT